MLRTYKDPMREKMGSAFDSHPDELQKMLKRLEAEGVDLQWRKDSMGYSPSLVPGLPGQLLMPREASYSAWLHEFRHFTDDKEPGYPGFVQILGDKELVAKLEDAAYTEEIAFARANGFEGIARRLERLRFERRQEVLGIQRNNKQAEP